MSEHVVSGNKQGGERQTNYMNLRIQLTGQRMREREARLEFQNFFSLTRNYRFKMHSDKENMSISMPSIEAIH